ncbi:uncharacterized protein LOC131290842 [Anopheles ziemanni]|uniref:uncharacterized protein LOC131268677 n=1 Tax=Anopheles coustani TaxID=139045 RepID=UPI002657DA0D|nr:uncharacterized protein LOC131268677 [Anopheles coustani]XP_058126911.1 uncharacterized protein LOC131268677 [Anopheles coustani]XP_058176009.1 uncharacterized protein LOC131290842 [Anopheles ziemanni]
MKSSVGKLSAILLIMLSSVVVNTDCCSSRSMPKSRPRPVSHFRGVMTSSTTTSTTTTFVRHQQPEAQPPIQAPPETTSTGTNVRFGPGGGGGGVMVAGGGQLGGVPGIRDSIGGSIGGKQQQSHEERALPGGNGEQQGAAREQQQRMVEEARQRGRTTGSNEQLMRMGRCSQLFEENYCLNGGKCHNFTIANSTMPTCECADGFMGERCESKYLDGTYLSMRKPKIHIETASVYYGAFLALMVLLVVFYYLHLCQHCRRGKVGRLLLQEQQDQQEQQLVPPSPVHREQLGRGASGRLIRAARA